MNTLALEEPRREVRAPWTMTRPKRTMWQPHLISSFRAEPGDLGKILIFEYAEDRLLIACRRVLYKYTISSLRRLEPYSCASLAVDWQQYHSRSL